MGREQCIAVVSEAWQLPESLMEAPKDHRELAAPINLGANLALACGNTFALEPAPAGRNVLAMVQLGLAEEGLDSVD